MKSLCCWSVHSVLYKIMKRRNKHFCTACRFSLHILPTDVPEVYMSACMHVLCDHNTVMNIKIWKTDKLCSISRTNLNSSGHFWTLLILFKVFSLNRLVIWELSLKYLFRIHWFNSYFTSQLMDNSSVRNINYFSHEFQILVSYWASRLQSLSQMGQMVLMIVKRAEKVKHFVVLQAWEATHGSYIKPCTFCWPRYRPRIDLCCKFHGNFP